MILVAHAPAYLTIQDMGRQGYLAAGVPRGGAMDRWTLAALNLMIGNQRGAAGFEWALNGGALEFRDNTTIAMGGAEATCTLNGVPLEPYRAVNVKAGETLVADHIVSGRFLYIAVAAGIACKPTLGSRSTYLAGGFGGINGRRLQSGDSIETGVARRHPRRHQVTDALPHRMRPGAYARPIRIVTRSFDGDDDASRDFLAASYSVSAASDRTGYRLEGPASSSGASVTSEPVCPGAIQLPPGGAPIILMADAPTIGGYRLLGSVATADLGSFSQKAPD